MTSTWRKGRRIAVIGAGPGGVSAAIAFHRAGYDVRLFERNPEPRPLGGAVLLSVPVMAIMRSYGIDINERFGQKVVTEFRNHKGKLRVRLPFNPDVERAMGIEGWHYGILRSSAFGKLMDVLNDIDPQMMVPGHEFAGSVEREDEVEVRFTNGETVTADLVVGADGIRSGVAEQAFGDPKLFHAGIRVWLAWCKDIPGLPKDTGVLHHSRHVQASYFPMKHDGEPGFEWWVVEKSDEGVDPPSDPEAHLRGLLREFPAVMQRFPDHTDFTSQMFRWEIYNKPSLPHYTKGRVALIGDAAHPVSPYAAYGMGMAIEDGYFLARSFGGADLTDPQALARGFGAYEADRVAYCNHVVEFARKLGTQFHRSSAISAFMRDLVLDNTPVLRRSMTRDYLKDSEKMSLSLSELHVA